MSGLRISSGCQQVADYLRGELSRGRWRGTMPGRGRLAVELGVSGKLIEAGLALLEGEGRLVSQGPRRRRRVVVRQQDTKKTPSLRVAILAGEPADLRQDYQVELRHELVEAGHHAFYAPLMILEPGMSLKRIQRMVGKTAADAWVVTAGSDEVIKWFAAGKTPAFALFGRRRGLPSQGWDRTNHRPSRRPPRR